MYVHRPFRVHVDLMSMAGKYGLVIVSVTMALGWSGGVVGTPNANDKLINI